MSNNPEHPLKIGIKYCGGCRPDYDRTALVSHIIEQLGPDVEFVSPDSSDISMVLAVYGCQTACADLDPFKHLRVWGITDEKQAADFIEYIRAIKGR